jgi:hypothetical protein
MGLRGGHSIGTAARRRLKQRAIASPFQCGSHHSASMKRTRFICLPTALAALFGCTSPLGWYAACGCAEVWSGVVGDVGVYWADMRADEVTPDFLAEKTIARLHGQSSSLETVRTTGIFFDSSCASVLLEVRCTFWLWANGDELRGIELQFVDTDGKVTGVVGQYVYGKRGARRG